MQRVIKRTFNQSSLVDELMCEWAILPDAAAIWRFISIFFPFLFSKSARGGRGNLFHCREYLHCTTSSKLKSPINLQALFLPFYTVFTQVNKKMFTLPVGGVSSEESSYTNKRFSRDIKDGYQFYWGFFQVTSPDHLAAVTPSLSGWTGRPARPAGMATVNPWDRSCKGPWVINKIPITCLVPVVCYFNTPFVPRLQSLSVTAINSPTDARTAY